MTTPQTPGEAIRRAAQRLAQQREAARALSQEIADQRRREEESGQQPEGEGQ